jgi:hypothetical protein
MRPSAIRSRTPTPNCPEAGIYRVTGPPSEAVKTAELSVAHARMGSERAQAGALSALALAKTYAGEPAAALDRKAREPPA